MITTTLNRIRAHRPCEDDWEKALKLLGKTKADDEPLTFVWIAENISLGAALWCCRAEPQHEKIWRLFNVFCARRVQHLMKDPRSIAAIDVAERHANGLATDEELAAARAAALAAARAASRTAEWWAAWAAWAATWTVADAVRAAADVAARAAAEAADAAAGTARTAWSAARTAWAAAWTAWSAADAAEREAQKTQFIKMVSEAG